jgi:hypothetical protein
MALQRHLEKEFTLHILHLEPPDCLSREWTIFDAIPYSDIAEIPKDTVVFLRARWS